MAEEVYDKKNIEHIFAANKNWAKMMTKSDKDYFTKQAGEQNCKYLWIGCADARVPANEVVGLQPGEIYVTRNVANLVVNTDFNMMSVLQFAVEFLQVEHIIVCGHYKCGGVAAALELMDHTSPLENWIRNIRDTVRLHKEELLAIPDIKARQRRLVEINVREQCINLYKTAVVQRRRAFTHVSDGFAFPRIHGVTYDPDTGELKQLNWNAQETLGPLQKVYTIYDPSRDMEGYSGEPYEKRSGTLFNKPLYNRRPL